MSVRTLSDTVTRDLIQRGHVVEFLAEIDGEFVQGCKGIAILGGQFISALRRKEWKAHSTVSLIVLTVFGFAIRRLY
jgi:hypothetical protein